MPSKTRKTIRKKRTSINKKTLKKSRLPKTSGGVIRFEDYPDFQPNLTPEKMFRLGSFGGSYWRPIYSGVLRKNLKNAHKKYPDSWWKGIPAHHLTSPKCDISINKYKVRVGTSLEFWEQKKWITKYHPYGWVQWYCDFYTGKRSPDDERQISRWKSLAGPNGRFRKYLVTLIKRKYKSNPKKGLKDYDVSPKIRQVLQHWGTVLTSSGFKVK